MVAMHCLSQVMHPSMDCEISAFTLQVPESFGAVDSLRWFFFTQAAQISGTNGSNFGHHEQWYCVRLSYARLWQEGGYRRKLNLVNFHDAQIIAVGKVGYASGKPVVLQVVQVEPRHVFTGATRYRA